MKSRRLGAPILNQSAPAEYVNVELRLHRKLLWCAALSLVFHGLLVWLLPERKIVLKPPAVEAARPGPLVVRLNDLLAAPPPAATSTKPLPVKPAPATAPRVLASIAPTTEKFYVPVEPEPAVAPPTPAPRELAPLPAITPVPTPAPPTLDFAAALALRRAARGVDGATGVAPTGGGGGGNDPSAAAIARNVATLNPNYGSTGGVFQILHKGHRAAQFAFNGWKSVGDNKWRQVIEVDAGQGGDVETAIVKKMIELIRTHYQGEFSWESHRLRRVVPLSAAPQDNAALEAFLLREFFG